MQGSASAFVALRRRSYSLSSSHPSSPSPSSPVLPAPDFGDPLCSSILPSPSFSHLDYFTSGSTISRRNSFATSLFTKRGSAVYPTSATMSRGDTRRGLGSYERGKTTAHQDALQRLHGEDRAAVLSRSVSLKPDDDKGKPRRRSQSFSVKSIGERGISSPAPMRERLMTRRISQPDRGIGLGDKSVDLGGRYQSSATSRFTGTSTNSEATPLSGFRNISPDEVRIVGRPLHPALCSEVSTLSSSTIGFEPRFQEHRFICL